MQLHELLLPELSIEIPDRSFYAVALKLLIELFQLYGVVVVQLVQVLQLLPQVMVSAFLLSQCTCFHQGQ